MMCEKQWLPVVNNDNPVHPKTIVEVEMMKPYPRQATWVDAGYSENYDWRTAVRYRIVELAR